MQPRCHEWYRRCSRHGHHRRGHASDSKAPLYLLRGTGPRSLQSVEIRFTTALLHCDARTGESHITRQNVTAQVVNHQCESRYDMASPQPENCAIRWKCCDSPGNMWRLHPRSTSRKLQTTIEAKLSQKHMVSRPFPM